MVCKSLTCRRRKRGSDSSGDGVAWTLPLSPSFSRFPAGCKHTIPGFPWALHKDEVYKTILAQPFPSLIQQPIHPSWTHTPKTLKPLFTKEFSVLLFMVEKFFNNWKDTAGFPGGSVVKNPPANIRLRFNAWVWKIPWRRKWQSTPVFLPGKSLWTEEPGGLQYVGSWESDLTQKPSHKNNNKKIGSKNMQ